MNENIKTFLEFFLKGDIPSKLEYSGLTSYLENVICSIENENYIDNQLNVNDFYSLYTSALKSNINNSSVHFSHLINIFDKISQEYNNDDNAKDLNAYILDVSKNDDFKDFNQRNNIKKQDLTMGSIDQMLMGMENKEKIKKMFGIKKSSNEISAVFENDLLKEYVKINDELTSLIVLKSGYKRLNTLIKTESGILRVVYSSHPENNKIGINIYFLDNDGHLISSNDISTYSALYYSYIESDSFLRVVSAKKEGVDFLNSSIYSLNNSVKIANSLTSICILKDVVNYFSEPFVKSFDFFVEEEYKDKTSIYKKMLATERDSFLFSGNKGRKNAGEQTNKSVLKIMPPIFFGLVEFSTLEMSRIINNDKNPLEISNYDNLNLLEPVNILKAVNGYFMALDAVDMLSVYDFNINPIFGKWFSDQMFGYDLIEQEESVDGFALYCTRSLTHDEIKNIYNYSYVFPKSKTSLNYSISEIDFFNDENNTSNKFLARIDVIDTNNSNILPMPLIYINNDSLNEHLKILDADNYQMEYFIVDLRKYNLETIRFVLDNCMNEVNEIDKISLGIDDCGYFKEDVTEIYKGNKIFSQIAEKAQTSDITIIRVNFVSLPYLNKYKISEDFYSSKLCQVFFNELGKSKSYLTSSQKSGENSVDFIIKNDNIKKFNNDLSVFKNIAI